MLRNSLDNGKLEKLQWNDLSNILFSITKLEDILNKEVDYPKLIDILVQKFETDFNYSYLVKIITSLTLS